MHRVIRDHLEEVLSGKTAGSNSSGARDFELHLNDCAECRDEVAVMREQASALSSMRTAEAPEQRPGFYARVMERIEAHRPSIWSVFSYSPFGRRIAVASFALALIFGVYVVSEEHNAVEPQSAQIEIPSYDQAGLVMPSGSVPDRDAVLVNLVTYKDR